MYRDSDWHYLFDMQHHYIPTRLLDWTTVLGVAIFFALLKDYGDSAIFMLNPEALNTQFLNKAGIVNPERIKAFIIMSCFGITTQYPFIGL
jgi:hypothetical protein